MNAVTLHETSGTRHCSQSKSAKPHRRPAVSLVVGCMVLLVISALWSGRAAAQIIDGTRDASYGPARAVQASGTAFGNNTDPDTGTANGSELDSAYAVVSAGRLNLLFTGNLESNFNKLEVFIDFGPGGQNRLRGNNPDVDFDGLNRMGDDGSSNGLTFDVGFDADFYINVTGGLPMGGPYEVFASSATLPTAGGGVGVFLGSAPQTPGQIVGTNGIIVSIDNSNILGVNALGLPNDSAPDSVTTGIEMSIPLDLIGGPLNLNPLRVVVFVNGLLHDFTSNQFLAPLPLGTGNLGEPRTVNLSTIAGDQFFSVEAPGAPIFLETFSDDIIGQGPNGPDIGTYDQITPPTGAHLVFDGGGGNLRLRSTDSSAASGVVIVGNPTRVETFAIVDYDYLIESGAILAGSNAFIQSFVSSPPGTNIEIQWDLNHLVRLRVSGAISFTLISGFTWAFDTDYHVEWHVDAASDTVSLRIDNTQLFLNEPLQNDINGILRISFASNFPTIGSATMDNIRIVPAGPITPAPEACCLPNGSCLNILALSCLGLGGTPQGVGTNCTPNPCPPPTVACCFINGTCQDLTVADCGTAGGTSQGVGTACGPGTCQPVRINEIRTDQPSTNEGDMDEYFELSGPAGVSLSGLTYLVIGDFGPKGGVIEEAVDLTGQTIPATGFFVAAEDGKVGATNPNPHITSLNFENNDNVSHMLVEGFFGAVGDDLDLNDDGVLDLTPWTQIIDEVALVVGVFGEANPDPVYTATTVGPNGPFVPGHVFRMPDSTGPWQVGNFEILTRGLDTPGAANATLLRGGGPVTGACCIGAGCSLQTEADCVILGGNFIGPGTTCTPTNFCVGSCCLGASCTLETEADCIAMGGFFRGNGTDCTTAGCPVGKVVLNEIWSGDPQKDDVEFVEMFRPLGFRGLTPPILAGLSFIVVNGDTGGNVSSNNYQRVTYRIDFGVSDAITAGCFFLMGTASAMPAVAASPLLGCTPPILNVQFPAGTLENHSQTYALVRTQDLAFCSNPANPTVAPAGCPSGVDAHRLTDASVAAITANLIDAVATRDVDPADHVYFGAPVVLDGMFQSSYMQRTSDGVDTDTAADWDVQWNLERGDAGDTSSMGQTNTVGAGACCVGGACTPGVTRSNCELVLGGVYKGNGSTCTPNPCIGACCVAGVCSEVTAAACATSGGVYFGDGVQCPLVNCAGETIAGARALGEPLGMILSGVTVLSVDDVMGTDLFKTIQLRDATGSISVVGLGGDIDPILAQVQVGDVIDIAGTTKQYLGLFELIGGQTPLQLVSNSGPPGGSTTPVVVSTLNFINGNAGAEALESDLVRLECVSFFAGGVGVFQADVTYHVSDGAVTVPARVHVPASATSLIGQPIPVGAVSLTGIFWQQDFDLPTDIPPENQGYQLRLRKASDIGASSCIEPLTPCCAPSGACACAEMTEGQCLLLGGTVIGPVGVPCPPPGACEQIRVLGDIDGDQVVTLADVDLFVKALVGLRLQTAQLARADLDCQGGVNGLDIPLMIAALVP